MGALLPEDAGRNRPDWARLNQWLLWLGLAGAVLWLVWRHGAHLVEVLPFLVLLACPLLHLFGHGHHSHGNRPHQGGDASQERHP